MKNKILLLISILIPLLSLGQYLPVALGDSINSIYDEINPVLSPSGDTLYFSRVGHPENRLGKGDNQDIWFSVKKADGSWATAVRMPDMVNRGRYNALFSISPDGKQALINGVYNRKGRFYKERGLSIITRTENGWGKPKKMKVKGLNRMMDGRYFSAHMNWEQGVIVMSFSKSINSKRSTLFVSRKKKNNNYSHPSKLRKLNAPGNEFAPFLSEDGNTLFFATDRWDENGFDIVKVEKEGEGWKEWGTPQVLLGAVNTLGDELYYKEVESGAYYSSEGTEKGNFDLYYLKKE